MLTGPDAIRFVTTRFPDWLPPGARWRVLPTVSAPHPPLLRDVPPSDRVTFLLNAYLSFFEVHAKPGTWDLQKKRACGLRSSAPQFRGLRASVTKAADVMAGEAWGELQEVVDAGKIPAVVAPHAWLLWGAQNHFAKRGSPPNIERIFSAGQLLNEESLRVFSHSVTDLVSGSTRKVDTGEHGGSVQLYKERYQETAKGIRDDATQLADILGRSLTARDMLRIQALREEEVTRAVRKEAELVEAATNGFWVWGRWIAAEGKKVLWHPMAAS